MSHLPAAAGHTGSLLALPRYQSSSLFTDREKAALDYTVAVMRTPVEVTDELFTRVKEHFSDKQVVEITAPLTLVNLDRFNAAFGIGSAGFRSPRSTQSPTPNVPAQSLWHSAATHDTKRTPGHLARRQVAARHTRPARRVPGGLGAPRRRRSTATMWQRCRWNSSNVTPLSLPVRAARARAHHQPLPSRQPPADVSPASSVTKGVLEPDAR